MSNSVQITLLCEDSRHEQFISEFMRKKGRDVRRDMRRVFPSAYKRLEKGGVQPNNAFVLQGVAREVKEARKAPPKRALVVVIDGDERGFASRQGNIAERLRAENLDVLNPNERIATVIPCRNIETWVHHFKGNPTNETDEFGAPYPKNKYDASPEAEAFAAFVSDGTSPEVAALPALNAARTELRRLHALMK